MRVLKLNDSLRVWSSKEAASRLDKSNMAVLIINGVAHAFPAEDGNVSISGMCLIVMSYQKKHTDIIMLY